MGALGSIISTIGLARLMDLNVVLPLLGQTKDRLPFPIAGLFVIIATVLVFSFVHEQNKDEVAQEKKVPVIQSIREIAGQKDKSALWILLSLFFWFLGYQGILPFVAKMSIDILHTSKANAALPAAAVGIAQAVFAIPAGYIAHKIGRRKTIRISLIVVTSLLILGGFLASPAAGGIGTKARFFCFLGMMFVYGIFWIAIITNSFPMLWQMATYGSIGIYTGLYYTFSQAAAIISPTITGGLIDLVGYPGIFGFAAVCMLLAFYFMSKVKKGEPTEKPAAAEAAA